MRLATAFLTTANKLIFQSFFERLHTLSLLGMNIGGATMDHEISGEAEVLRYVRDRSPRPAVIFDVGANIGLYASLSLDIFGEHCRIYCFEPSAKAFKILSAKHGGDKKISLHNFAISDSDGKARLFSESPASVCASLLQETFSLESELGNSSEEVSLERIDSFCQKHNVKKIDLLKIDVEGQELSVLEGCGRMLADGKVSFIQFEFGRNNIAARTFLLDFFKKLGPDYVIRRVVGNGLRDFSYAPKHEIFVSGSNFLASWHDSKASKASAEK